MLTKLSSSQGSGFSRTAVCCGLSISILLATAFGLGSKSSAGAWAAQEDDYADGLVAYQKRDYKLAGEKFWASITGGNNSAGTWLYLAHSYAGQSNRDLAIKTYRTVRDVYKGSPEAGAAIQALKTLDPHNSWKPADAPVEAKPGQKLTLKERITIIPPRSGHQAVNVTTISAVRTTLAGLPTYVYKVLNDNNATTFVGPNIIDKWPDAIDTSMKGASWTLAEEDSHVYGRDMYIWERSVVHHTELSPPRNSAEISRSVLIAVGHALNDCLGVYSNDPALQALYRQDVDDLSKESSQRFVFYLSQGNNSAATVCAHMTAVLLGNRDADLQGLITYFPRTAKYVRAKLRL